MIFINLFDLMYNKKTTISDISRGTGVSRSTIYNLATNQSKGVQWETLDKLCVFLDVSVSEIIEVCPFEISYKIQNIKADAEKSRLIVTLECGIIYSPLTDGATQEKTRYLITFVVINEDGVYALPIFKDDINCLEVMKIHEKYPKATGRILIDIRRCFLNDTNFKENIKKAFDIDLLGSNFSVRWKMFIEGYRIYYYSKDI